MKLLALTSVCLLLAGLIYAQEPEYNFAKSFGGSAVDKGNAIVSDDEGNIYLTGEFSKTVDFGSGITVTSAGNVDFFLAKFDKMGNAIWVRTGGGILTDRGYSLALDGTGNVYACGSYFGTAAFADTTITSMGNLDAFIIKYDTSGNFKWIKEAKSISQTQYNCIKVDGNKNVLAIGYFGAAASNIVVVDSVVLTSYGDKDILIVKYDSSGNLIWARNAGSINTLESGESLQLASQNSFYITGNCKDTTYFGNVTAVGNGGQDIFLAKYNAEGEAQWAVMAGGAGDDKGRALGVDAYSNVYMTGHYVDSAYFDGIKYQGNGSEMFIAKYNPAGGLIWVTGAEGTSADQGWGMAVNHFGESYITGKFLEDINFGPVTFNTRGKDDIIIAKYDASGNFIWAKQAGGIDTDNGYSLFVDSKDKLYATGYTKSPNPIFDNDTLTTSGAEDIFMASIGTDVVPVELISFKSSVNNGSILLSWETASETNNMGFEVERKSLKGQFEKIGFIKGSGTSSVKNEYSFTDKNLSSGEYNYRLKQVNMNGSFEYSNIIIASVSAPDQFALEQNYPNPFNPTTNFEFRIPATAGGSDFGLVRIKIYDALGKEITTLVNEKKEPGTYSIEWKASGAGIASGVYFYTMTVEPENGGPEFRAVKKMMVLK